MIGLPTRFLLPLASLLGAGLFAFLPDRAEAFHREGDGGANSPFLYWSQMPVPYSLQSRCALGDEPNALNDAVLAAGEDETTFNQLCHAAVQRAFHSWEVPACTSLRFAQQPDTNVKEVGYDRSSGAVNLNTVQFMTSTCDQTVDPLDPCWNDGSCDGKYACFGQGDSVVALTRTFFVTSTGRLVDADIEVNAGSYSFSAEVGDPLPGTIDVQNTLTHEAGHFIGLAHSCDPGEPCASGLFATTMYWQESNLGETTKRTLKQDDIDGVCAIYPLGGASTTTSGCGTAPGVAGGADLNGILVLGTALLIGAANRTLRQRKRPGVMGLYSSSGVEDKIALL